jgi:predicted esterase
VALLGGLQFGCAPSTSTATFAASRSNLPTPEAPPTIGSARVHPATNAFAHPATKTPDRTATLPQSTPAEGWHELPLEGFEPALVYYVPQGPKLVVTHGAGGHAEWHCEHYRRIFEGRVSLLCARGKKRYYNDPAQGYYYPDHRALSAEVLELVATFETRFEPRSAGERYVYTGYSQGATMGALAFASEGGVFSHLLLVEGGYADFSRALARRFQSSGGSGVLFVCGTKACHDRARAAVGELHALGIRATLEWARGAGHRPDGPVTDAFLRGLPKIFETEPGWSRLTPKRPDDPLKGNG